MNCVYDILNDNKLIICDVPSSVTVRKNAYGMGLFSNVNIKKGEILYRGIYHNVSNDTVSYTLQLRQNGEVLIFNDICKTQSVKETDNVRQLYTFDGFMNHSCSANTTSGVTMNTLNSDIFEYDTIAVKDINIGDEITCNYLEFDYECDGHSFECLCGSTNCVKQINGFKNCSLEQQIKLLPRIDSIIYKMFLQDNPNIIIIEDLECPDTINITKTNDNFSLISTKVFLKGETIFVNETKKFDKNKIVIVKVNNEYVLLDNVNHFLLNEDETKIFYGFDTFCNHSCDSNSFHEVISENLYKMVALKNINIGDEITCDYDVFDPNCKTKFICNCGSINCRKII